MSDVDSRQLLSEFSNSYKLVVITSLLLLAGTLCFWAPLTDEEAFGLFCAWVAFALSACFGFRSRGLAMSAAMKEPPLSASASLKPVQNAQRIAVIFLIIGLACLVMCRVTGPKHFNHSRARPVQFK